MMEWLSENVDLLTALSSLGMLVIWLLYLHLFFRTYREQRRPNLLIHQAGGFNLDSRCVIANMSETAVHLAAVLVDVERGDDTVTFQPRPDEGRDEGDPLSHTRQGPLTPASYLDVGSFGVLLDTADRSDHREASGETVDARVVVRVVAFLGSELHPAGAMRAFEVQGRRTDATVQPASTLPVQLSSRRQRRVVKRWLEEAQSLELGASQAPLTRPAE